VDLCLCKCLITILGEKLKDTIWLGSLFKIEGIGGILVETIDIDWHL